MQVRNLIHDNIIEFQVKDLIIFIGTDEEALEAARYDESQYVIKQILGYKGTPEKRNEMMFLVIYDDGDQLWTDFKNISDTLQFEYYINTINRDNIMKYLLSPATAMTMEYATFRKQPINISLTGTSFYLNIKYINPIQYDELLELPNHFCCNYYVQAVWGQVNKKRTDIRLRIPNMNNKSMLVTNIYVQVHGNKTELQPNDVLLSANDIIKYKIKL